jgi:hypothetical protein
MSDYFFYDLNKKMADLANKQQLTETAAAAPAPKSKLTEAAADYSAKKAAAGKDIGKPGKNFGKIAAGAAKRYGSAEAGKRVAGAVLNKLRHPSESIADEGNAFSGAVAKAKSNGIQPGEKIRVGGKQYPVKETGGATSSLEQKIRARLNQLHDKMEPEYAYEKVARQFGMSQEELQHKLAHGFNKKFDKNMDEAGSAPMTPKQKSFAKLAPPVDKITFADKIVGAKKEVDEVLGDVAAMAMKKAIQRRTRDMEEGSMDDDPFSRKSSTGGRIDTTRAGVTRHHAGKSYSGAGHDAGADDTPSGALGRRKVGAGKGTKIGAKINTGKSKLMTREGDMDPADQGEYDQEGSMAKDDIKTVVRHAQALEKILGDNDNLPEWVQAKLAKIEGMMTAVDDYMQNQQGDDMDSDDMKMDEESTDKRDSRAERAGKKVAKDIEYDEKKKDGIHGKRRGSEDDKAERAGKKVTKDIEYDEKKSKKKEVDETTSSGSVATGGAAPKSGGGMTYGKGIYDSMNREVEKMISESMSINMSMNNDSHGGPSNTLTVTATDEDALQLAMLLKSAGLGSQGHDDMSAIHDMDDDMSAIHDMDHDHGDEPCPACGSSDCECDEIEEAYGDTDATDNEPNWPTDQEGTDDAMMYSGGLNGPKSTGQTTVPVIAGQDDRMGYEGSDALCRMMEMAGLSEAAATPQDVPEPTAPVKKAEAPGSAIKVDKNYKPAAPAKGSKLATPQDVPEPVKENKMAQNFLRELSNFKY